MNRHLGKVFWISLIFSSANIENFAEAIPIRLKVPFLLHGKSFNILPSWRGTSLVFQINMCICLFIWKIQLRLTWKNIPPTSIFQVQKLRYFPINTFILTTRLFGRLDKLSWKISCLNLTAEVLYSKSGLQNVCILNHSKETVSFIILNIADQACTYLSLT